MIPAINFEEALEEALVAFDTSNMARALVNTAERNRKLAMAGRQLLLDLDNNNTGDIYMSKEQLRRLCDVSIQA